MRDLYYRFITVLVLVLLPLGVTANSIQAQASDSIFFEETGHWVRGLFLEKYQSADDPLLIFGYPISDEILDINSGITTQYFQRARMDQLDGVVEIAALGKKLYSAGTPLDIDPSKSSSCRYFPGTEKSVCYAFLQFYDQHKGYEFFGYPISDLELQEERYVQYFEKARMEFRPEMENGERIALADLGSIYLDLYGSPVNSSGSNIIGQFVRPQVKAFVSKALISSNEEQTLYIIAQDQHLQPIEGAMVLVVIHWLDGESEHFRPEPTNADGISVSSFQVGELEPQNIVEIEVTITYQDTEAQTSTWFRTWW